MRTWNLPGTGRLLEWKRDEGHCARPGEPLFDPADGRVEETHRYYLITNDSRVREYESGVHSLEFNLYRWGHAVVGSELLRFESTHNDLHDTASYRVQVELDGLQPAAEDPEATARVRAAIDRAREESSKHWAEHQERVGALLASFRAALLARRDTEGSPLVFDQESDAPWAWVVRTPGGVAIWRTTDWGNEGRELHRRIRKVALELGAELTPNPDLYSSLAWTTE